MIKLYEIIDTILFWIAFPFFVLNRIIEKKSYGYKEKFGNSKPNFPEGSKVVMLHGCSVGEVMAIENLAKAIKERYPEYKLVVTTSTKNGQDIAQKIFANVADYVTYFPFDIPQAVNKFLDNVKPSIAMIVETEIWPYFAYGCKKRGIPVNIINGRISDSTYKTYKLAKPFFKRVFENYTHVYVQSKEDGEKYISIGMRKEDTEFMGNLKFDVKPADADINIGQGNGKIWIAGSTHKGENEIVIETYKRLKVDSPDLKLLIAPRHMHRVDDIKELLKSNNLNYGLRSSDDKFTDKDIIILDTLGELKKMYAISDVAFIGGSFNKTGGHNPLEAAVYNKPTLSGPCIHNFKDIYSILSKSGAGCVVHSSEELYRTLKNIITNDEIYNRMSSNCKAVFEEQNGAIEFVLNTIK